MSNSNSKKNINSQLIAFINRRNNEPRKVIEYPVCKAFTDENGEPIKWKIIKKTAQELQSIRDKFTRISRKNKDAEISAVAVQDEIMGECIIYPNLKDVELADALMPNAPLDQRTPGNLLKVIVDDDAELQFLFGLISELHRWNKTESEMIAEQKALINEAKNS